ncbi:MAG: ferritin family protein [Myxococcota bacterium]|nr:ferritin family protein [Myxococcota bacterium]
MTDAVQKKVADGLIRAMRAEHEGQYFYLMASRTTEDAKGKDVFLQLAKEEQLHFDFLKRQYEAVVKFGRPDATLKLGTPIALSGGSPIFSERIRSRIQEAHYEMTALSVAVQLELDAQNHYRTQADEVSDLVIKTFYSELADWEAGHYRALLKQQEALKEDYWDQGGFAPF